MFSQNLTNDNINVFLSYFLIFLNIKKIPLKVDKTCVIIVRYLCKAYVKLICCDPYESRIIFELGE
ncbi:hypothetical protein acsn021_31970 [Anaerocolumna cellulosilytica]|uniref:Uncharacterized protein n=1 Tax=Anaerocolumna cellulosilytica TaxID=433286 RepID=A0A6S6R9J3_9FIRM|nr:hypothetical protein acsn021_31970 [Anaerocolumna cellulosilytica]